MSSPPSSRERFLISGVLVLASAAFIPVMVAPTGNRIDIGGDTTSQRIWVVVYAAFIVWLVWSKIPILASFYREHLLVAILTLAVLSTLWSDAPGITLRRSVAFVLTSALGVYLVRRFDPRQLVGIISNTLLFLIVFSAIFALVLPKYGLDRGQQHAWRGVFTTKNELGRIALLSGLFWGIRVLAGATRRGFGALVVLSSCAVCLQSSSKTSEAILALVLVLIVCLPLLRGDPNLAIAAGCFLTIGFGAVGFLLVEHTNGALNSVGADSTFTGRTAIWTAVWAVIQMHFAFGFGYGAFWLGGNGPSALIWNRLGATPPHAHNGMLEVWLELGAVGVSLVGLYLMSGFFRSIAAVRHSADFSACWSFVFLVAVLGVNLTESTLIGRNALPWILTVVAVSAAGRRIEEATAAEVAPGLIAVG